MAPYQPPTQHPLLELVTTFLLDLTNANRSVHTRRAYATELRRLAVFHPRPITTITPDVLRGFFAQHGHLSQQAAPGCRPH